jgi:hypothetical protein
VSFAFLFRFFFLDGKLDFLPRVTAEHLPMTAERVHLDRTRWLRRPINYTSFRPWIHNNGMMQDNKREFLGFKHRFYET